MLAGIDALQSKLRNCGAALYREPVVLLKVGESEPEFVNRGGSDRVIVGDEKATILIVSGNIRQKLVCQDFAAGGAVSSQVGLPAARCGRAAPFVPRAAGRLRPRAYRAPAPCEALPVWSSQDGAPLSCDIATHGWPQTAQTPPHVVVPD